MPVEQYADNDREEKSGRSPEGRSGVKIPVGANLLLSMVLACLAIALHAPVALAFLGAANLVYLGLNRVGWGLLWKAGRIFLWQSALLLLLHHLRFGPAGLLPGLRISCQLFLAFLPGMIFLRGTGRSQLSRATRLVLPPTAAFVLGASLHFIPLLVREAKEIYLAQLLRGARIHPRDICKPRCWIDWIGCLIVPVTVHALALAGDIALAARIRDFGSCRRRTFWPAADTPINLERQP